MRVLSNLLFKVTLSSMILTAPAMITGRAKADGDSLKGKEVVLPFYSSAVIARFIEQPSLTAIPKFTAREYVTSATAPAPPAAPAIKPEAKPAEETPVAAAEPAPVAATTEAKEETSNGIISASAAKAAELRMVINQAVMLYSNMKLERQGLDPKAFEYAWRGYYNLLKKGVIRKRTVLSICDFSQSCCSKRMYVIDVRHRKLLFRTYVAHGQNSGEEYATSFSNEPDSYKSSLGFYVTNRVYYGRNGLSLRLNGVDSGYNDLALKRNIVLHGSSYVGDKYMQDFGTLGTSLGCPALPAAISGRIIRAVKDGSCLFIYHPTQQYLDNSIVINS
ncbi:MAG: murein L,D-transpeptidase catalytic domain family protein [Bacteroidetes bacterium]|nr:murein L,D-transpeptidase catalytic domain family protein [Bacteroidota bacterium]